MPQFAALVKVSNCRQLGATVVLHGADVGEARIRAEEIARRDDLTFLHPFDNADVIAGQGTMALEILEQAPDLDAIVVPVGGGGLLAGIGTAVKALRPQMRVIGVEPDHAACLTGALAAGRPVPVPLSPTLADGLAVPMLGALPFEALRRVVDEVVTVAGPVADRRRRRRAARRLRRNYRPSARAGIARRAAAGGRRDRRVTLPAGAIRLTPRPAVAATAMRMPMQSRRGR